jgi:polyhydroxybutyrate depolymerase
MLPMKPLLWCVLAALLISCGSSGPADRPTDAAMPGPDSVTPGADAAVPGPDAGLALVPGDQALRVSVGSVERRASLHVPAGLSGPRPLVVVLHGTGGSGEGFASSSGWNALADAERFVTVFPSALRHCFREDTNFDGVFDADESSVTAKWADGKLGSTDQPLCDAAQLAALPSARRAEVDTETLADDMAFVAQLVDELLASGGIDGTKVYVSGFSNGGNMAARLIVEDPARFAAAHVAAGFLVSDARPAPARPVLLSFGTVDGPSLARTGVLADPSDNLRALPFGPELLMEPTTAARFAGWQSRLGLSGAPTTVAATIRRIDTLRFAYAGAPPLRFEALVLDGMGHVYGDGTNHPVDIAAVAWAFFAGR